MPRRTVEDKHAGRPLVFQKDIVLVIRFCIRSTGFVAIDDMTVAATVNTTTMDIVCTTVVRTGCRIQNLHQGPRQQLRPIQDSVVSVYRGIAKLEQYRQWSRSQTKSTALGSLPSFPPRSVQAGHEEMPICTYVRSVYAHLLYSASCMEFPT